MFVNIITKTHTIIVEITILITIINNNKVLIIIYEYDFKKERQIKREKSETR